MKFIYRCFDLEQFTWCNSLDEKAFDRDALKVYWRLCQFHHTTYFVGGCIRDLLLGRIPKDFDLVTSAQPQQIRKIFYNSRIIGRRFRLVHIFFGNKIVEVATFRRPPTSCGFKDQSPSLLIKHDNSYGTDKEDAWRRDFTINALFYDHQRQELIDYVGAMEDFQQRKIRTVGDAEVRFQEDPIRMIRALKFASQLNFDIVHSAKQAISNNSIVLNDVASPRLLLEVVKILQSGAACKCFHHLAATKILQILAPGIYKIWINPKHPAYRLFQYLLKNLDEMEPRRRKQFKEETLLSTLCLPLIFHKNASLARNDCWSKNIAQCTYQFNIPKRLLEKIVVILANFLCFEREVRGSTKKHYKKIMCSEYFQETLDFIYIWSYNDASKRNIYQKWQHYAYKCHARKRKSNRKKRKF